MAEEKASASGRPVRRPPREKPQQIADELRHLIVSGGLGTSILPVRFGVPPEIVLIKLGQARASA